MATPPPTMAPISERNHSENEGERGGRVRELCHLCRVGHPPTHTHTHMHTHTRTWRIEAKDGNPAVRLHAEMNKRFGNANGISVVLPPRPRLPVLEIKSGRDLTGNHVCV